MKKKTIYRAVTVAVALTVIALAVLIMWRRMGLQEDLPFGAGSYYYADIPDFDKYLHWDAFSASLPYWAYLLIFLLWGALMYLLWVWIDTRGKN